MNILSISKSDPNYPDRLKHLHKTPERIYIKGADVNELLEGPTVGIVGARKVTGYGRSVTDDFASYLAGKGVLVVSGLALGVDSLAHQAAIKAGGKTLTVLPSGIEKIYPATHFHLANKIVETGGTIVSEYEGKMLPMHHHFVERNRVIAALSDVLLVTEAAEKSGSLHTAKFALELGKTVAAVPGDIYSPMSAGCNNLIKSGAQPVTNRQDLMELLGLDSQVSLIDYYPENETEKAIIELLKEGVNNGDELIHNSSLEASEFQQTLTMLELKSVIRPLGNNNWTLS